MNNKEIDKIVSEKVCARLEALRNQGADALRALPSEDVEELEISGKKLNFCTYRDQLENNETLIIVQCKNTRYLGYGHMFAEGLVVSSSGDIRNAEEKLMWEYV
jgi:hypothetical protein